MRSMFLSQKHWKTPTFCNLSNQDNLHESFENYDFTGGENLSHTYFQFNFNYGILNLIFKALP